jgi:hypothetical protein
MNNAIVGAKPLVMAIYLPDGYAKDMLKLAKVTAKKIRKETGATVVVLPRSIELSPLR